MHNDSHQQRTILYIVLAVLGLFIIVRLPVFGAVFFRLLLLAAIALGVYGLYWLVKYLLDRRNAEAYSRSTEGRIKAKIDYCEGLLEKNREEMEEIQDNIRDLRSKVQATTDIRPQNRQESQELLSGFQSELQLRQAKAAFYQRCIRKLESLLRNHQLMTEIEEKKHRLRALQENNYEELAQLEEIKSDLEMDSTYLDTIDELSLKMLESDTVDDAEHLRLELEEMTRELDEL